MSTLDELDRVIRERVIGSPPHSLQHLGTMERLKYIERVGTMGVLGTVMLTVDVNYLGTLHYQQRLGTVGHLGSLAHVGTLHYVERIGTVARLGSLAYLGSVNYINRMGTVTHIGTIQYIGSVRRVGTVHYQQKLGTVAHLGTLAYLGTLHYVQRLGTVAHLGSMAYLGTLHYIQRLGTINHIGTVMRVGSIGRIGTAHTGTIPINIAAQDIMAGVDVQARYYSPVDIRDRVRLGPGSIWTGSWYAVDRYAGKSIMFKLEPGTTGWGSLALIGGMSGSGIADGTFTYYPWERIRRGSSTFLSWTEAMEYIRPKFRHHSGTPGSWVPEAGGTLSTFLGRQA